MELLAPMRGPDISGQHRVPSVDASDPMGGQSGPVYGDELEINFALFRAGNPKPIFHEATMVKLLAFQVCGPIRDN